MPDRFSRPKDSFFAECEGTESEGAALVELADRFVTERSPSGSPVLHEMLEQSGATEALALSAGRLATPAEIFDAFASPQRTALREQFEQFFEIVALPRTPLDREIQEGDVMVRRGDGAMGHISVIASGELFDRQSLAAHGLTPESASEGRFVQVVETGARPHSLADNFSRRVTGLTEAMPADTMVLRMRKPTSEAIWQGLSEGGASSLLRDIVILRLATPPPTTVLPTVVNVTAPAATPWGDDSEDIACEYLDPSGLSWPEASPEQADFMRRVYVNQVNRACQTRSFVGNVPEDALGQIEGSERAVRVAADQCRAMLAAARAAMSTDTAAAGVTISVISGYRSASHQLHNWNRNFPRYFQETQSDRAGSLGGELGAAAAALLARYISRRLAAPGFSLHNNGLAVDLGTVQNGRSMGADTHDTNRRNWRASWFFRWLTQNAARFNFYQNTSIDEPWHWEFRGPVTSESEGEAESNQEAFVCEGELEEAESWTGSDEQTEFREKVLDEHIARTRRRKGPPQRDLTRSELKTVEGTTVEMRTDAAEAASELLAAANHDLETTTLPGSDSDAAVTIRISAASGYRSADHQRRVWREHFAGYYNQTRAARESLPGGAHSAAAVTYMLETFKIPNRVAAPGYSNHQGGIAIDFQQVRAKGHEISNSYEASAQRKWRASWFFQWLQQNAQSWKFKPYEKEAWHWEYKPVLEKTSNQPSGRSLSLAEASARTESVPDGPVSARDLLGGFLWRFTSNTLSGLKVAAFCTKSGSAAQDVDVLLYAHGLIHPCPPVPRQPEDLIVSHPFKLGEKLDASNRAMVLVVPFLNWEHLAGDFAFGPRNRWHGLAKPKNVNALVEEVLTGLGQVKSARPPGLRSLLIAGHSRAYDFLDPLAHAYADPLMRQGALAKLSQVWAFDTSYSCPVEDWKHWIDSNPGLHVSIIFRKDSKTSTCGGLFRMGLGGTSRVSIVELNPHITHCEVPGEMLPRLLGSSAPEVQAEYEAEEQSDRDSADLATDSEAAYEGELGEGRIEDSDTETFELSVEGESERVQQGAASQVGRYPATARSGDIGSAVIDEPTSPRFEGDKILSNCFHDKARLGINAKGPAVVKIQAALIDLGYDLGPWGADGSFGAATAVAVRAFKRKEQLGFEQYGDVGPGTMRRLDRIFAGEANAIGPTIEAKGRNKTVNLEPFVPILLAPPNALQVPPEEGDCPPDPVASRFAVSEERNTGLGGSGVAGDPCLLAPAPPGAISDFEADLRKNPARIRSVVIDPDNPDEIIGYRVGTDSTVLQIVDREGNFVTGNEKSLDTPMLDPIDFIPSPGTIAKGTVVIGKVGLKVLGKLVAKEVASESLWKVSAAAIPRLRGVSAALLRRGARAAAKNLPTITRKLTEEGLNHSFDRHAAQWFGGTVRRETHFGAWRQLLERAMKSTQVFPWSLGSSNTIAHLALIDGKYLVVHFFEETGELASAFVPSQRQLQQMFNLLAKMK